MVLEKFGTPAWEDILDGAGMPRETAWVSYEYYPDGVTVELVLSAAKKLGAGADDVLQIFGGYFVKYLKDNQLDKLIHIMGDNLKDFLWNLDYLHAHLQDTFPSASFPHFRVEDLGESKGFTLFYQSSRGALLAPFVQGLVKAISMELFKTEVEMTYEVTEKGAVFHILNNPSAAAAAAEKKEQDALIQAPFRTVDSNESVSPTELSDGYVVAAASLQEAGLDMSFFLQCWPFFMLLDSDMHITACGTSLHARIPEATEGGVRFADLFEVLRPHAAQEDVSFASFLLHTNVTFKVQSKEAIGKSGTKLVLRGAMHHQGGKLLFLASAHMLGIDDMVALGCHMSELPLHDAARDLLFMSETRTAEAHLNKRLDRLSKELAQEQVRSDELLHSMLPSSVVEDLREGRKARGKHHEAVTILFSDIVGFTDISSLNKPQQVCNMLDELYTCFDTISSYFDVYKVETIGDAYMIAGGIVGDVNKHATAVADMAFAMHAGAKLIRAPHNGEPIHIRVGIHTGPAMTGVVGIKMPRFCFFGDTVNTASRMEINGLKGKSHLSASTAELLQAKGYLLEPRGVLQVKGKGEMETFWLRSHPEDRRAVIKEALTAAKKSLDQLKVDRQDSETSEDSVSPLDRPTPRPRATETKKKARVHLWERGSSFRNLSMNEDDRNLVEHFATSIREQRGEEIERLKRMASAEFREKEAAREAEKSKSSQDLFSPNGSDFLQGWEAVGGSPARPPGRSGWEDSPGSSPGREASPMPTRPLPSFAPREDLGSPRHSRRAGSPLRSNPPMLQGPRPRSARLTTPVGIGEDQPGQQEREGKERASRMVAEFAKRGGAGKCPFGFDKLARAADAVGLSRAESYEADSGSDRSL